MGKLADVWYHLTRRSSNEKTGKIAVSTTSADTCGACPVKCYADKGPISWHWAKVTSGERGIRLPEFLRQLFSATRTGTEFRHCQAGDQANEGGKICRDSILQIADAARFARAAWSYTHLPRTVENISTLLVAQRAGFVVNLSTGYGDAFPLIASLVDADRAHDIVGGELGVTVVTPRGAELPKRTPAGLRIVTCPAIAGKVPSCQACTQRPLCARVGRGFCIAFPDHG